MQIDIVVGFFILGMATVLVRSPIDFPKGLYQSLVLFLLLAIGLKGGVALSQYSGGALLWQSAAVLAFGFILPLLAFPILYWIGGWKRIDAAATAAHYGSVSVGTYAVAIAVLEAQSIAYEPYIPLFVALLEVPAIATGLLLAKQSNGGSRAKLLHELFFNQGVVLLVGGIAIGWWAGERSASVMPFFATLFHGILALFLLQMGRTAAERFNDLKQQGSFLLSFGILMPLLGALAGGWLGYALGLSLGGVTLLAVLGGSASYIAVPAALAVSLPKANISLALTASLAVTFPFNVIVGIPVYLALVRHWMG